VPFAYLNSGEGVVVFGGVLVMVLAFPLIFLGEHSGASVTRTFLWSTAIAFLVAWVAILVTSRPQPSGRLASPAPVPLASLVGIAIFLTAVLPVPFLAALGGLGEGFFIACELVWLMDMYRVWRWRRSQRAAQLSGS
jgi:hypothetical protein